MSQEKDTIFIVNNCFRFQDTSFYFKPFEKGGFVFLFDVFFRQFCETHRVKGCDKNVSYAFDK